MKSSELSLIKILTVVVFCLGLVNLFACNPEAQESKEISDIPEEGSGGNKTAEDKREGKLQEVSHDNVQGNGQGNKMNSPAAVKHFQTGNQYSKDGQFVKAIEAYRQAIALDDALPSAHYNLANIYVATGKTDEAIGEYQTAIKLNPRHPDYHRNLGFAYALLKNGEMAEMKYEELKKLAPIQAEELWLWIQKGRKQK